MLMQSISLDYPRFLIAAFLHIWLESTYLTCWLGLKIYSFIALGVFRSFLEGLLSSIRDLVEGAQQSGQIL